MWKAAVQAEEMVEAEWEVMEAVVWGERQAAAAEVWAEKVEKVARVAAVWVVAKARAEAVVGRVARVVSIMSSFWGICPSLQRPVRCCPSKNQESVPTEASSRHQIGRTCLCKLWSSAHKLGYNQARSR